MKKGAENAEKVQANFRALSHNQKNFNFSSKSHAKT